MHEAVFGPKEEDLDGDALVAKKNLWTCISCDKDLDKYQGKLGDYKGWAQFPPKNTNPDKMGKVVVFFSFILYFKFVKTYSPFIYLHPHLFLTIRLLLLFILFHLFILFTLFYYFI